MDSPLLGVYNPISLNIKYGEDNYLFTDKKEKYLDTYSGIAVNILGHRHPVIDQAIQTQSQKYLHLSNVFESSVQNDLAKQLINKTHMSKVFFSNSGTEANEAALKIVRKWGHSIHPNKKEIIAVNQAFHGRSSAGMALSNPRETLKEFAPLLGSINHVKFNDINHLKEQVSENTCAIFLELIYGSGGLDHLTHEFLAQVSLLAKQYHFLIVVDEIQTGLYRTGPFLATFDTPLNPDIVTLAKGIGGGLPLGATLVNEKLKNILVPGDHGSTFGGNPLACALGDAILNHMDQAFLDKVNDAIIYLNHQMKTLKHMYPLTIKQLKGKGFMRGIEVGEYAAYIQQEALKHHVLFNTVQNTTLRLLPALTFNKTHIDQMVNVLRIIIDPLEKRLS